MCANEAFVANVAFEVLQDEITHSSGGGGNGVGGDDRRQVSRTIQWRHSLVVSVSGQWWLR